jgi:long-chain acyl-CoA synthetase
MNGNIMSEESVITYLFSQIVQRFPGKTCLQIERDGEWERYTYSQVEELSRKVASFLIDAGAGKGDFVLLILENCPEWAIFYLGILNSGACVVPIDPQLTIKEIENITADCKPKAIFTSKHTFQAKDFLNLTYRFEKIALLDLIPKPIEEGNVVNFAYIKSHVVPEYINFPRLLPDDNASLIYTSGTTGQPKGVLLSHHNFCSNAKSFEKLKISSDTDTFLSLLPLFHSYAFMAGLLAPILTGATISYCLSFKSEDVAHAIKNGGVTIVPAVPQFLSLLRNKIFAKYDKSPPVFKPFILFITKRRVKNGFGGALRLFISGGARLDPPTAKDIVKLGIALIEGYGLTETSPLVTLNLPEEPKFGSVGKPVPEVEVKINNPNQSGIGEVLIKGDNVMKGYFKRPDLTGKVIKDGWFFSGDLGYIDGEDYLYITGRIKEVIVLSSGKNIYPGELETVYRSSPYIKEICILSREDQRGLYAVAVPDFSYFRKMDVMNIYDRIKWEVENISRELPTYHHIMGFTIMSEDLPRTRLGKIKRFELQNKYGKVEVEDYKGAKKEKIYSDADLDLIQLNASREILSFLVKRLKKDVVLDDNLEVNLGIDSLGRIELTDGLEDLLNIKIPNEFIARIFTVRELLNEIKVLKEKGVAKKDEEEIFDWKKLLNKLPPKEMLKKVRLKPSIWDKIAIFILIKMLFCVFRVFWRLKVEGIERLPRKGPYVICPNHASYLDGFIVPISLPYKVELNTFFLGYAAYFEHPLVAWGIRLARLVPLDPNVYLIEAMQTCAYILKNDKVMCIFPEGRRSVDENPQDFKKGVGILAKELDIPLVPVFIKGSHFAWPRTMRFPRPYPLKIIYGHPLTVSELLKKAKDGENDYERIVKALREEVSRLAS